MDILIMKKGEKNRYITLNNSKELVLSQPNGQREVLYKDMTDDFDLYAWDNGDLDIFGINSNSALIHIRFSNGALASQTILEPKSDKGRISNVKVHKIGSKYHLFYCINLTDTLLVHQVAEGGDFTAEPKVVARIGDDGIYDTAVDELGNIHILYAEGGTLYNLRYTYNTKSYTNPNRAADCNILSLCAMHFGGKLYCAYVSGDKRENTVALLCVTDGLLREITLRVNSHTQVALVPLEQKICVEWVENSMAFMMLVDENFERGKVRILGRSPGLVRPKSQGGDVIVSKASINLAKQLFCSLDEITKKAPKPQLRPKGQEVDELSRKYIEVLSRRDSFVDFEREFTRIEASLERLVQLVESALGKISNKEEMSKKEEQ